MNSACKIMSGRLEAGATVDTEELASSYDVSRTVVREALKVLAGKGLIDARPRRGTYVRERTNWNLLDPDVLRWQFDSVTDFSILEKLHEVRVMVEPAAAELAAQRRTPDDLAALFAAVDDMAIADATADAIADADLRFHLGLIAATHNELVEQLSIIIGIGLSARDQYRAHPPGLDQARTRHAPADRRRHRAGRSGGRARAHDLAPRVGRQRREGTAAVDGTEHVYRTDGERRPSPSGGGPAPLMPRRSPPLRPGRRCDPRRTEALEDRTRVAPQHWCAPPDRRRCVRETRAAASPCERSEPLDRPRADRRRGRSRERADHSARSA